MFWILYLGDAGKSHCHCNDTSSLSLCHHWNLVVVLISALWAGTVMVVVERNLTTGNIPSRFIQKSNKFSESSQIYSLVNELVISARDIIGSDICVLIMTALLAGCQICVSLCVWNSKDRFSDQWALAHGYFRVCLFHIIAIQTSLSQMSAHATSSSCYPCITEDKD